MPQHILRLFPSHFSQSQEWNLNKRPYAREGGSVTTAPTLPANDQASLTNCISVHNNSQLTMFQEAFIAPLLKPKIVLGNKNQFRRTKFCVKVIQSNLTTESENRQKLIGNCFLSPPPSTDWIFRQVHDNYSVTTFGDFSPLWQNIQSLGQVFQGLFTIWQNFGPTLVNFVCPWANFR